MDVNERIAPIVRKIRKLKGQLDTSNERFIENIREYVWLCEDLCKLCLSAFEQGYRLEKEGEPAYQPPDAEELEIIADDLFDDFVDYVTSGVPNAAPYCANQCPECVNGRGWCNWGEACKGFYPKAAKRQEADDNGQV